MVEVRKVGEVSGYMGGGGGNKSCMIGMLVYKIENFVTVAY
jgi:hypothetical protein